MKNPVETLTPIEILRKESSTMSEILKALKALSMDAGITKRTSIGVSGNITTDLFSTYLKKQGYLTGQHVDVLQGDYGTHIDNFRRFSEAGVSYAVLINFFDNLLPSLESQISNVDKATLEQLGEKLRAELTQSFANGSKIKTIYALEFHSMKPKAAVREHDDLDAIIGAFNEIIRSVATQFANVVVVRPESIFEKIGLSASLNPRFYYQFKAPYTSQFFDEFSRQVSYLSRAFGSYFNKVLVLDCDNTLWGGIIGEDLLGGIKLEPYDYPGNIFWSVQQKILSLQKAGVLLCLNSKNNAADVDEVISKHEHCLLKDEHIVLKFVNWTNKVENLKAIAQQLNLGLDSFVFVDDSDFECNAVKTQLPAVKTFQVPKNLYQYPALFDEISNQFAADSERTEGQEKTKQYKQLAAAAANQSTFANQQEYLASLGLKLVLKRNAQEHVKRIAELSQKSNQFNVTTRRYTEAEIIELMNSDSADVYSLHVSDNFGDHGLTGVAVVKYVGDLLDVENFLMSCRVIGRGVEFVFWRQVLANAQSKGCQEIEAHYLKSPKNSLVVRFFDELGLALKDQSENRRDYRSSISELKIQSHDHVEVTYVD